MTLEALRLRVANRQRTKERHNDSGGREDVLTRKHSNDKERKRQTNGTVDTTYEALLQCQEHVSESIRARDIKIFLEFVQHRYVRLEQHHDMPSSKPQNVSVGSRGVQASQLTAAFHRSETKRLAAAKRRRERLTIFRKTQDQLLHPPKLYGSGDATLSPEQFENTTSEGSRRRHILDIVTDKSWNLAEGPAQRDRARRAHTLAVAAAKGRGRKVRHWQNSGRLYPNSSLTLDTVSQPTGTFLQALLV